MRFAVLVQRGEDDRHDNSGVVANQRHDIFVIPIVQSALGHLQSETHFA